MSKDFPHELLFSYILKWEIEIHKLTAFITFSS